ncbi:phosphotransferase, partial [Nonomuraea fuscirosea]
SPAATPNWVTRSSTSTTACPAWRLGAKRVPYELLEDDAAWRQPLVAGTFPPELRGELIRLHRDREEFLAVMEALPRALCHLDLWPSNVIDAGGESVLLDWAFTGDGALGEDVGNHIPDSVFDLFLPAAVLPELDAAVYGAYLRGLRESGWRGDERLVRLAVCASAVKYDFLAPLMLRHAGEEQVDYGGSRPVDATRRYRERGAALMYLAGWADEARKLAATLFAALPTAQNIYVYAVTYDTGRRLARGAVLVTTGLSIPIMATLGAVLG